MITEQSTPPPLEWVRVAARAAELITALAHPDLAALVAAAPRRPGAAVDADELRGQSGLELRAFAAAVSRGRNTGVLAAPAPGRLAVDHDAVEAAVGALTALTPLGPPLTESPELARFARYGRIVEIPDDPALRIELLRLVVDLVQTGRDLTEAELNSVLRLVGDDPATLRRELVESGLLDRAADGSSYHRG